MNCRRTRSLLSAYIDAELTGYEMLAIREHLSQCIDCKSEHLSLLSVKRLLSAMPDKEPRPELVFALQNLSSRSALDLLLTRLVRDWQLSLPARSSAGMQPAANNRRLAYACMVSLLGAWFIVAPTARAPRADQPFAPRGAASRLLSLAGLPGARALFGWNAQPVSLHVFDAQTRPVALNDTRSELISARMAAPTPRPSLNMLSSTQDFNMDNEQPATRAQGGYANVIYSGYSVPSSR